VRSGSIDLVIGKGGSLSGYTVEESNLDRGSINGSTKPSGAFSAEYVVRRQAKARKYVLTGSFVCEGESIAGMGVVTWGQERGNLKFRLQEAP
jgi:hypothetical protein